MKKGTRVLVTVFFLLAALVTALFALSSEWDTEEPRPGGSGDYFVRYVVDGDTFFVEDLGKIRLLNIDTPERGETGFYEAKERLEELAGGRWVRLYFDVELLDRYGRYLAWPEVDGRAICPILIAEGLAKPLFIEPNTTWRAEIDAAVKELAETKEK
jgi:endonuclease YncB( thermonuclease family)